MENIIWGALLGLCGAWFLIVIGISIEKVGWQHFLVKRNLAEYYLDADNNRQWRLIVDREGGK